MPRAAPRANMGDRCKTGSGMASVAKMTPDQQQAVMQHMMKAQQPDYGRASHGFATTNRMTGQQIRNRYAGMLSEKEIDEAIEAHEDSGMTFRRVLLIIILVVVIFLAWVKYDIEEGMDLPPEILMLAERDAVVRGEATTSTGGALKRVRVIRDENAALEQYYRLLNVKGRIHDDDSAEDTGKSLVEADRQHRVQRFRVKKALKASFDKRQEEYGQLVHCGRTCEAEHTQLQLAYDTLTSTVDRELFGVLFDENIAKTGRADVNPRCLKTQYAAKVRAIESDTTLDEEMKSMELADVKEAYDIFLDPAARAYYFLHGRKPPEMMKRVSARHGGWGLELLLGTHRNRFVLAWLDYLQGAWADYTVLCVIDFAGFVLPAAAQLPRILELAKTIDERQSQMEVLEKRAAARGRGASR